MRTSKHHRELTEGVGKCSVPMWQGGVECFCDRPAFGKPVPSEMLWNDWNKRWYRADGKYDGYVPGLACPGHGGPECPGMEIEPGVFSGCDQSAGDCPTCGE